MCSLTWLAIGRCSGELVDVMGVQAGGGYIRRESEDTSSNDDYLGIFVDLGHLESSTMLEQSI